MGVLGIGLPVLAAGHPLLSHAMGAAAVEMLAGGLLGFGLGGVGGWNGGGGRLGLGNHARADQPREQSKRGEAEAVIGAVTEAAGSQGVEVLQAPIKPDQKVVVTLPVSEPWVL